jgi:hypothetical protein
MKGREKKGRHKKARKQTKTERENAKYIKIHLYMIAIITISPSPGSGQEKYSKHNMYRNGLSRFRDGTRGRTRMQHPDFIPTLNIIIIIGKTALSEP